MTVIILASGESRTFFHTSWRYISPNMVAQHPIENATDTGDNIEQEPEQLVVDIYESNQQFRGVAPEDGAQSFVQEAEGFWRLARSQVLAISIPDFGLLTSYAIKSIERARPDNKDRLLYSVQFSEFIIANATTVRIPPARTNNSGGPDRQSLGQETSIPASDSKAIWIAKQLGLIEDGTTQNPLP